MRWIPVLLLLTSCSFERSVYVAPVPPPDPRTFVRTYERKPAFTGYELTFGIPGMQWVPVVGPILAELIQLRSGLSRDILVPVMERYDAPTPRPLARPCPPAPDPRVPDQADSGFGAFRRP